MHFFETWRFPLFSFVCFPTRVVSFSDDHPSLKLENPNNKPRGFSSHRLVSFPQDGAGNSGGLASAWRGELWQALRVAPVPPNTVPQPERGDTSIAIAIFPTRFDRENVPKRSFRNIPMEGSPPQKKRCLCVCVNEGNVLKYILYFGVPGVSLLELS